MRRMRRGGRARGGEEGGGCVKACAQGTGGAFTPALSVVAVAAAPAPPSPLSPPPSSVGARNVNARARAHINGMRASRAIIQPPPP